MDWGAVAIGSILAVLGYLASRAIEDIGSDIKDLKKSQFVTNERLSRVEGKIDVEAVKLDHIRSVNLEFQKQTESTLKEMSNTFGSLAKTVTVIQTDHTKIKDQFGRVIVVLKGLIQKK